MTPLDPGPTLSKQAITSATMNSCTIRPMKASALTSYLLHRLWNRSPRQAVERLLLPFRRPHPAWHRVEQGSLAGCELYLDPKACRYWGEMLTGGFEDFLYTAVKNSVDPRGRVFWDIGAHFGYASLMFAALAGPEGRVIAFEPNSFNLERFHMHLDRNPALHRQITTYPVALSNQEGEVDFSLSPEVDWGPSTGSHLGDAFVPLDQTAYAQFTRTKVRAITIDASLARGEFPPASIVKVDVEGAESFVLDGAMTYLNAHRPLMFIEIHSVEAMLKVVQILDSLDYTIEIIENSGPSRCFVVARPPVGFPSPLG